MSLLYEQRQKESSFDDLGRGLGNVGQNDESRNPRKYLVLLHDCLCIKFVPLVSSTHSQSHPFSFAFNSNGSSNNPNNIHYGSNNQTLNYNIDHQRLTSNSKLNTGLSSSASVKSTSKSSHLCTQSQTSNSEVDHSLHGLYLYKGFLEANLKCYWNSALYEAFCNLEYRGYIVPSIVLVWAIPRFFTTLRTAWSRQMLRSPPGFRIEFIGEIEELITDPIQQSQFAPLSDSLCWAILEITSMGQEAFVDSILQALSSAFPQMVQPNRELVYSTLEKLTRERKVYQTSQGYFVVTPDTFRYMISSNSNSQPHSEMAFNGGGALALDALVSQHQEQDPEKESISSHSWDSTVSAQNSTTNQRPSARSNFGDDDIDLANTKGPRLRRHNSLKVIRQKDNTGTSKGLGPRSMSFRLYKSKSVHNTMDSSVLKNRETGPTEKLNKQMQNLMRSEETPRRNSLSKTALSKFRKLFRKSSSKQSINSDKKGIEISVTKSSTSTQTPTFQNTKSMTMTMEPQHQTSPDHIISRPSVTEQEKNNTISSYGHFTLPFEYNNEPEPTIRRNSCWSSLPLRPASRQSVVDDQGFHVYATPASPDNFPEMMNRPQTLVGFPFARGESSRCSTLSQGTSLGYGSQGQGTSLQGFTSQSPSPSSTSMSPTGNGDPKTNMTSVPNRNYKNYYDYYRRRYPTYTYAGPNTKPISHYEVLRNEIPVPEAKTEKVQVETKKIGESTNGNGQGQIASTTTTTTVNSTNNIEFELLLPLGKLTNRRKMQSQTNGKIAGMRNNGNNSNTSQKTQIIVGQPNSSTEVTTTVNRNGTVETHFDCDSGSGGGDDSKLSQSVQIKVTDPGNTNVFLVNKKTGAEKRLTGGTNKINGFSNEFTNGKCQTVQA